MTDKQIIIAKELLNSLNQRIKNLGEKFVETQKENNKIKAKLKAKEQECEELKKIIDEAKNSKLDLKSFLVGEAVQNEYEQQLDQLKKENEECIKDNEYLKTILKDFTQEVVKLKQTLAEIKPILEFYANTTLGEKQEDGTYKLDLTFPDVLIPCPYIKYDPNPAKEALRKINEVDNDRT